ncbi:DUF1501 domain-containing protein [Schlesneria paludicola]|uniref:DUF1501 domain-containing protein n=1 Tax=Schlesneria paludicola TaxID=360056 RepID=UPI00029A9200|nr:DUF1501 domain-containing protein [Schlesneria paludicola]
MLRILGSRKTFCDGLSRRDLLHVGGLGALGLSLADSLRLQAVQAAPKPVVSGNFGKAKSCILLFPYGSPPQHETFDPKPEAPVEIQGEMKAISSNVPGLDICEYLPRMAQVMDRVTVVRSMTHPYPVHGVAYATTGMPTYDPSLETRPRDPLHWPFIGSVVDYIEERRGNRTDGATPRNIGMPWMLGAKSDLVPLAGPYAAFLGQAHDPFWVDFEGQGTHVVPKLSDAQTKLVHDPFGGVTASGKFVLPSTGQLPQQMTLNRLHHRRSLLEQFDRARVNLDADARGRTFNKYQDKAFSLLTSTKLRDALDISRETESLRARYGMTLFGQSCLAARRLVEAGSKFVTVFWDSYEIFAGSAWDTHANHFPRLKEFLLPGADLALSGLILDLDERGLLDETLVLWMSEHGRTPQIDSKPMGAGRHHWSRAYSIMMAGGGTPRGGLIGSTDRIGGDVKDNPISPKDILATAFHLLGIDPHTMVHDHLGRPLPIAGDGTVREELCTG